MTWENRMAAGNNYSSKLSDWNDYWENCEKLIRSKIIIIIWKNWHLNSTTMPVIVGALSMIMKETDE